MKKQKIVLVFARKKEKTGCIYMKIDINTKFITLIGDPLKQSFAARMQNVGYEAADLNMVYFYTETGCEHLGEIMKGIRCMPWKPPCQ